VRENEEIKNRLAQTGGGGTVGNSARVNETGGALKNRHTSEERRNRFLEQQRMIDAIDEADKAKDIAAK
jgi:hypothetical protein